MASNFTKNVISAINIKDVKYNIKAVPFHATEAEWNSMSYIPKQGEFIVYDVDSNNTSPRFKTGDGVTDVKNLPFTLATISEVQAYVNSQISSAGYLKRIVLEDGAELPDVSEAYIDTIYMKRNSESRLISDVFDEYMVINGAWEIIGNTRVDLSDYTTQEMVDEKIETAISNIDFPEEIYINDEAPENPKEDMLWLDTDEEAAVSGGGAAGNEVFIGTEPPTDANASLWIDTDEEGSEGPSINVTASVGQTIAVEEVDANGKPTKWKAAEYQPRTHWMEEGVLYEGTLEVDENGEFPIASAPDITIGETYKISWNGVEYSCVAVDGTDIMGGGALLGNVDALTESGDTGEPFVIMCLDGAGGAISKDNSTSVTLSIVGKTAIPIPTKYLANALPLYVDVLKDSDTLTYTGSHSAKDIETAIESGRHIIGRCSGISTQYVLEAAPVVKGAQDGAFSLAFIFRDPLTPANHYVIFVSAEADGIFKVQEMQTT